MILLISVIGCEDPPLPEDAWYKRQGDTATIGCNSGEQTWKLMCAGTKWMGTEEVSTCGLGANTFSFYKITARSVRMSNYCRLKA